jgi:hypothetical protein
LKIFSEGDAWKFAKLVAKSRQRDNEYPKHQAKQEQDRRRDVRAGGNFCHQHGNREQKGLVQ